VLVVVALVVVRLIPPVLAAAELWLGKIILLSFPVTHIQLLLELVVLAEINKVLLVGIHLFKV
jgi:hypothetical protein